MSCSWWCIENYFWQRWLPMMMIIFVWILVEFKNLIFFNFKFEVPTASVCKGALGKYDLLCGCSVLLHIQNIALFKGRIHASSRGCPADATEGKDLDYLGSSLRYALICKDHGHYLIISWKVALSLMILIFLCRVEYVAQHTPFLCHKTSKLTWTLVKGAILKWLNKMPVL